MDSHLIRLSMMQPVQEICKSIEQLKVEPQADGKAWEGKTCNGPILNLTWKEQETRPAQHICRLGKCDGHLRRTTFSSH